MSKTRVSLLTGAGVGVAALLFPLAAVAIAATSGAPSALYAAPGAQGAGDCSSAADACTLATALADSTGGTTIYLTQAGTEGTPSTYYVGNWTVDPAGTSPTAPLTIEPAPGVSGPILDGDADLGAPCQTASCGTSALTVGDVDAGLVGVTIQDAAVSGVGSGGAIHAGTGGVLSVSDSTFSHDGGATGGAIYIDGGTLSATDSTFVDDEAGESGGAIDVEHGTATLSGSTFAHDETGTDGIGGALSSLYANLTVSASTFADNNSGESAGGAIGAAQGTTAVTHSTFAGNTTLEAGASIYNDDGPLETAADIFGGGCSVAGGTVADAGYNVGTDATCENGGPGDSTALTAGDLGPLADNGGPTETVMPSAGPALGLIPYPTTVAVGGTPESLCPTVDQRGATSITGLACDAGAVQVVPYVTSVSPDIGPRTGGQGVTVSGNGFTGGDTVVIGQGHETGAGAIPATGVVVVSPTEITATTGGGARAGTWNLFVVDQGTPSAIDQGDLYSYDPAITSVSPDSGPITGGQAVTITGGGFAVGDTVVIGQGHGPNRSAVPATDVDVVSPTEITAVTGAGAVSGTHSVYVITPSGASRGGPAAHYTYVPTG